ncbi:hypothetical protein HK096_004932 [Nowakowskiella sp. JEL0078]|nr:hypothetical protein HK096_004932 [Nowakowskiella sp. JEL0078]
MTEPLSENTILNKPKSNVLTGNVPPIDTTERNTSTHSISLDVVDFEKLISVESSNIYMTQNTNSQIKTNGSAMLTSDVTMDKSNLEMEYPINQSNLQIDKKINPVNDMNVSISQAPKNTMIESEFDKMFTNEFDPPSESVSRSETLFMEFARELCLKADDSTPKVDTAENHIQPETQSDKFEIYSDNSNDKQEEIEPNKLKTIHHNINKFDLLPNETDSSDASITFTSVSTTSPSPQEKKEIIYTISGMSEYWDPICMICKAGGIEADDQKGTLYRNGYAWKCLTHPGNKIDRICTIDKCKKVVPKITAFKEHLAKYHPEYKRRSYTKYPKHSTISLAKKDVHKVDLQPHRVLKRPPSVERQNSDDTPTKQNKRHAAVAAAQAITRSQDAYSHNLSPNLSSNFSPEYSPYLSPKFSSNDEPFHISTIKKSDVGPNNRRIGRPAKRKVPIPSCPPNPNPQLPPTPFSSPYFPLQNTLQNPVFMQTGPPMFPFARPPLQLFPSFVQSSNEVNAPPLQPSRITKANVFINGNHLLVNVVVQDNVTFQNLIDEAIGSLSKPDPNRFVCRVKERNTGSSFLMNQQVVEAAIADSQNKKTLMVDIPSLSSENIIDVEFSFVELSGSIFGVDTC